MNESGEKISSTVASAAAAAAGNNKSIFKKTILNNLNKYSVFDPRSPSNDYNRTPIHMSSKPSAMHTPNQVDSSYSDSPSLPSAEAVHRAILVENSNENTNGGCEDSPSLDSSSLLVENEVQQGNTSLTILHLIKNQLTILKYAL